MYKCKKCDFVCKSTSEIANHYKYYHSKVENIICDKCDRSLKNKGGLKSHLKFCKGPKIKEIKKCPKCNYEIKANYKRHLNWCDGSGPRRSRPSRGQGWSKGLTKENDPTLKKISEKLIKFNKENIRIGIKHTEETKKKLSELMINRYNSGWESTAGRCKKISYYSPIAGEIKVDGTWELKTAIYLDKIGVKWNRNKKRFKFYNYLKNKFSTYCPDFFIEEWNLYIEVKGYKTELDKMKWIQFKEKLEIWDKEKLTSLGIDIKYRKLKNIQVV